MKYLYLALIAALLTACSADTKPPVAQAEMPSVRDSFIALNHELERVTPHPELVYVGEEPNDGKGDPLWLAAQKITSDLAQLPDAH